MKKIFVLALLSITVISASAQFVQDYLKAADEYFQKEDYSSAAEYYEKYFSDNPALTEEEFNPYTPQAGSKKKSADPTNQEQSMYRLAESYRMLNYPAKAAPYYKKVLDMKKKEFPLVQYHFATQLRALGKYPEAEQNFKAFISGYKRNDEFSRNADRELKNLQFIQAQLNKKDLKYYTVAKAPGELNTRGASYAPAWLNATTLLFTSTRPLDSSSKNKYSNRIFQASYTGNSISGISKADLEQAKDVQQGVVSVAPDGNTMFLTRWGITKDKKESALYVSHKKDGDKWGDAEKLDGTINPDGSNTQQPFVTADGKYLLFSSNRSGGQGGYDLWYAPLENGKPGKPVNMGNVINTSYDEQAPSYHEASRSLIFSTNGRVGMGGYDFFQSKGTIGNWTEPVNLGYPVNSIKEDMYFISRGSAKNILEDVMLSSDRDAACCLELFSLKKTRPMRRLSGKIVSCDPAKPLTGATVTVVDAGNKTVFTRIVGSDGSYSFELEDYQPLKVKASATGFIPNEKDMSVPMDMDQESMLFQELCLVPEPPKVDEKFVVENVYYDFDKAELKPESFPALDEIVRMLNTYPAMEIELSAHTDSKGSDSYNMKLSEARAQSAVDYLVSKGIARERLIAKGYGETQPIAPNTINGKDNPEGREKNRRTEFKVLKNQ